MTLLVFVERLKSCQHGTVQESRKQSRAGVMVTYLGTHESTTDTCLMRVEAREAVNMAKNDKGKAKEAEGITLGGLDTDCDRRLVSIGHVARA